MTVPPSTPAIVVFCSLLAACGASQGTADGPAKQADKPKGGLDVEGLLARESEGLSAHKLEAEGAAAEVLSAAAPKLVSEQGLNKVVIPIASSADVQCIIYDNDPLPGSTFFNIVENMSKEFQVRQVAPGTTAIIGESPVTTLAIIYAVDGEGGLALGQLKLAFHFRLGSSTLCMHDELGYQKTFTQVASSFFETFDRGNPGLDASFVEVRTGEVNDQPAGHDRTLVFTDDGVRKHLRMGLLMLPASATALMARDTSTLISLDASNHVQNGRWLESQNGALSLDLKLERIKGKGNRYRYEGSRRGKEVKGEFETKDQKGLPSWLWAQDELKKRVAKPAAFNLELEQYRPGRDPGSVSLLKIARSPNDPPGAVRIKDDDVEALSLLDTEGRDQRSELVVAGAKIVLERAYLRDK